MYLATVIDVYSRRLVGYSMADHMRADLVIDALKAAVRTRGGTVAKVIFHSDLDAVAAALNARPRKTLGWRTPAEALHDHLRSLQATGVATTP